jgi:hypothetical protein
MVMFYIVIIEQAADTSRTWERAETWPAAVKRASEVDGTMGMFAWPAIVAQSPQAAKRKR